MDFIHDGIAGGDGEGGDAPRPAPAFAIAAHAAVDQDAKNKIFGEVGALADDVVNETELVFGEVGEKPAHDWGENVRGVLGGERVSRERKDDAGPGDGWPPGPKPGGNEEFVQAGLHFRQLWRGPGITPGLGVRQV